MDKHVPKKRKKLRLKFFLRNRYLLLNCPEISKYEWHPFTITSAPEEETVSVHMRTRGDWTRTLQTLLNPSQLPQVPNTHVPHFSSDIF